MKFVILFFRLSDYFRSPSFTRFSDFSDYTSFYDSSDSPSSTRFFDCSDYTIPPILQVLHDSPIFPICDSSDYFDCHSTILPILQVPRDSSIFPIIRFFRLFSDYTYFSNAIILLIILQIYAFNLLFYII